MELQPEELLLAAMVRRAIKDAQTARSEQMRQEAAAFVWDVAPCVAEKAGVPAIATNGALIIVKLRR